MKLLLALFFSLSTFASTFQGGDLFSRYKIKDKKHFDKQIPAVKEMILRTGKYLNKNSKAIGTVFYLKQTDREYIFVTNGHVFNDVNKCPVNRILMVDSRFEKRLIKCSKIKSIKRNKNSGDHIVFSVEKSERNSFLSQMNDLEVISSDPLPGTKLLFVGFGGSRARSRAFDIGVSKDSDCVYLSKVENKKILDTDNVFSTGCDSVSGDSGSAIINQNTGELVGVLFSHSKQGRNLKPRSSSIIKTYTDYAIKIDSNSTFGIDIRSIDIQ